MLRQVCHCLNYKSTYYRKPMKPEVKTELIELCRNKLLGSVENLQSSIRDLQEQANDYGQPKDRYDSFRSQLLRRRDMLAQQLAKELNEIQLLEKINPTSINKNVGFGSVIKTDELNYFLAIGLGNLETRHGSFYAISMKVPIATLLLNSKAGDKLIFREKEILIMEVI